MNHESALGSTGVGQPAATSANGPAASRAAMVAAHALLVGVAADLLVRDGPSTVGAVLWVLAAALVGAAGVRRLGRRLPHAAIAWLAVAVLVAAGAAWRDAVLLQVVDFWAALGALVLAAARIAVPTSLATRLLRELLADVERVVRRLATGAAPLLAPLAHRVGHGTPVAARTRDGLRLALLAGVPVLVFGALLAAGDPLFASYVAIPSVDLGAIVSHLVITGMFWWVAAGWIRAALDDAPRAVARAGLAPAFMLRARDLLAVLGAVALLFAAFLAAQLGWLVGGEHFLHARTGLTAAEYARRGFFEMIAVTMLVVPLLLATRAALPAGDRAAARHHTRWSLALLAMLALMLASAVARLTLYVRIFGLTADRAYPLVFLGWLAGVLGWLAATVLRGRPRPFAAGALWSGTAVLLGLHVVPVDALVARWNVTRASRSADAPALDLRHLAELGGVAADEAVAAVLAPPASTVRSADFAQARCQAAHTLLRRWGEPATADVAARDWRAWNAGDRHGRAVVRASAPALIRLAASPCDHAR